jgi:hypothetical protein
MDFLQNHPLLNDHEIDSCAVGLLKPAVATIAKTKH